MLGGRDDGDDTEDSDEIERVLSARFDDSTDDEAEEEVNEMRRVLSEMSYSSNNETRRKTLNAVPPPVVPTLPSGGGDLISGQSQTEP